MADQVDFVVPAVGCHDIGVPTFSLSMHPSVFILAFNLTSEQMRLFGDN